ncbi:serine/threonine-protein kinase haspin [Octopus vulgaris]|uniref:non-specific serine/threonine protein kinase n=1 Tax=Octopus vulgaris TaxID=6645 RepID=A0AA36BL50_OCTVU|nr:serine/threonine-protein kinase haspin [Octopus vulgaris]
MESKKEKVVKTYGRHKSRVIKTDVWEDNIKKTKQTLFSGSNSLTPDEDFVTTRKANKVKKRKAKKSEHEKENRCHKEKRRNEEKLFFDKDFVSSFSDSFKGSSPKNIKHLPKSTKKIVPPSTHKKRLPNWTKLKACSPDLFKESNEKSVSMHFSDFDNYELCISESPIAANPYAENFPRVTRLTTTSSDQLSETNDSNYFLRNKQHEESRDDVFRGTRAKKTKITTSTPAYLPVVRLEHSPEIEKHLDNLKNTSRENGSFLNSYRDESFEQNVENAANYSSMFSSSVRSGRHPTSSSPRRGQKKNNCNDNSNSSSGNSVEAYSSAKSSPFDCVVQLKKLDAGVEQLLSTESYISCEDYTPSLFDESSADRKSRQDKLLQKKQLSLLLSSCAHCSLDQPCGNDCAYMKYIMSSRPIFDILNDFRDNRDPCLNSGEFDSSAELIESSPRSGSKWQNSGHGHDDDLFTNVSIEHINSLLETVLLSSDEAASEKEDDINMENSGDLSLNDIREEEEEDEEEEEEEEEICSELDPSDSSASAIHSENQSKQHSQSNIVQRSPYETRGSKINSILGNGSRQTGINADLSEDEDDGDDDDGNNSDDSGHVADTEHSISHLSNSQLTPTRKSLLAILSPIKCPLSPKSKILKQCQQDRFISFTECIKPDVMQKCVKIGEGVYGEVFRTTKHKKSVALKIIPIEGTFNVNDCAQKTFGEMLPEIVISQELSELQFGVEEQTRNFISVNSVSCVKGKYPAQLLKQWDIFHKNKQSDNDRPDIFSADQLFVVFEFGDGGSTLEDFKFNNLRQAKNILLQVIYSLAVAESALKFEHRDLHWGNVLVHPCPDDVVDFSIKGIKMSLPLMGMEASIIDFTLSRLSKDDCTVFCDLAPDEELFQGSGDYQFHVYRMMKIETENQWDRFCPRNNVFWIHYLADKLLHCKKYEQCTRKDREILRGLRQFVDEATEYKSAVDLVFSCDFIQITDE